MGCYSYCCNGFYNIAHSVCGKSDIDFCIRYAVYKHPLITLRRFYRKMTLTAYEQGIADALADSIDSSRRNDRRYISGVREGLARWLAFLASTEDHTGKPPVEQLVHLERSMDPVSLGRRVAPVLPPDVDANAIPVPDGWSPPDHYSQEVVACLASHSVAR